MTTLGPPDVLPPTPAPPVRPALRRSRTDRVLGGVCGGIAAHLGIDPLLVRVAAVVLALASGVGVIAYLVAWVVVPDDDGVSAPAPARAPSQTATAVFGIALVAIGVVLLADQIAPALVRFLWPSLLVAIGVVVVAVGVRR